MNHAQSNHAFSAFVEALKMRNEINPSKDNEIALSYLEKNEKAIKAGMIKFPESVISQIIENQKIESKASDNFVAVKVNVKIVHCLAAMGLNMRSMFDKYSMSIIRNLIELQGLDNLNAQRSICSKIEIDELQISQNVKVYHNCNPSTASTQTSSTREMLRHLDLAHAIKRAKADKISIKDNKHADTLISMFATTV